MVIKKLGQTNTVICHKLKSSNYRGEGERRKERRKKG